MNRRKAVAIVASLGHDDAPRPDVVLVPGGAAAGLLDGYRATSNKRAFTWASSFGTNVTWVAKARWVKDRNRWTSAGVAAGMDMTLALVRSLFGDAVADDLAERAELEFHRDASWDPFAERSGVRD